MNKEKKSQARIVIREALRMNKVCSERKIEKIVNRAVPYKENISIAKKIRKELSFKNIGVVICLWLVVALNVSFIYATNNFLPDIFKAIGWINKLRSAACTMGAAILFSISFVFATKIYGVLKEDSSFSKPILIMCIVFWIDLFMPEIEKWLQYFV